MNRGNRTESLWEGNLPLRGSLRGSLFSEGFFRGFQRFLEVLRGFQRFLERFPEVFKDFSEVFRDFSGIFRGPLRDPLRGRFPSQRLSVLLPLIVLPLNLSPTTIPEKERSRSLQKGPGEATLEGSTPPSRPWRAVWTLKPLLAP